MKACLQIQPFPWRSLFLAPFASVPALTITGLGSSDAGVPSDFGMGLVFSLLFAVPASFVGILLVGVPVFLFFRPYKYALMLASIVLGIVVPSLMFYSNASPRTTLGAVASGVAVALAAYFLRPGPAEAN